MDSRKALIAIFGGVVFTTAIGILLTPYRGSSKRKKIADQGKDSAYKAEKLIKNSVTNGKSRLEKMDEYIDRMVNEGGNTV